MQHHRDSASNSNSHKPSDLAEHALPPDAGTTEGGPRGREIIPDSADQPPSDSADDDH